MISADQWVFLVAFGGGVFFMGYELGEAKPLPPVAKVCPAVEGQQVISSSSTKDGEYCTYANAYGKQLRLKRV
jgi:hypothetical protein